MTTDLIKGADGVDLLRRTSEDQFEAVARDTFFDDMLGYAKLPGFAEMYQVGGLAQLALNKLNSDLDQWKWVAAKVDGVIKFAEVVCDDSFSGSSTHKRLKIIVVAFLVRNAKPLVDTEAFQEMLKRNPGLAGDLVKRLVKINDKKS